MLGLVDCTILGQLIGAGAPVAVLSDPAEVAILRADWNGTYLVSFEGDLTNATGAPNPARQVCVGFSSDQQALAFSHGPEGTVPSGATIMYIGGDLLFEADLSVYFVPEGFVPAS